LFLNIFTLPIVNLDFLRSNSQHWPSFSLFFSC